MEYQHAVRASRASRADRGTRVRRFKKAEAHAVGELQRSDEHYRRAAQEDPQNPSILIAYALLCSHLDMNGEAMNVAKRVLKEKPPEMVAAAAYTTLIEALRAEGNYKEANRLLEEMLTESKSNYAKSIAYYEKAYNLAEMGENLDEALESAQLALKYSPRS